MDTSLISTVIQAMQKIVDIALCKGYSSHNITYITTEHNEMTAIEHIVHNIQEVVERFQGKDCDNINDRKRVYKELEKAGSPIVECVSSATFNTIVHTIIGTINALSKETHVMPTQETSVMPSQETKDVTTQETIEKNNTSIAKKDVDFATNITDNVAMPDQSHKERDIMPVDIEKINIDIAKKDVGIPISITEKGEGQLNMFELTLEDRVLALENAMKAMAELVNTRPQPTLNRVKIKPVRSADAPANYKGYTVNFGNSNYRLIKRVGGRLRCIHVGKEWSTEKADAALARWRAKDAAGAVAAVVTDSILGVTA